jgi:hypothetical protein
MDFPHGNLGFLWISMFDRMGLASNLRWSVKVVSNLFKMSPPDAN